MVESSIERLNGATEFLVGSVDYALLWDTFHAKMLCSLTIVIYQFVIVDLLACADMSNSARIVLQFIEIIMELPHGITNKDPIVFPLEGGGKVGKFIGFDVH